MNRIFKRKNNSRYNLRQISEFSRPREKPAYHGSKSVSFLGPKIWDMLQHDRKNIDNFLRIKFRNGNLEIVLVASLKSTLNINILLETKKKSFAYSNSVFGNIAVAWQYFVTSNKYTYLLTFWPFIYSLLIKQSYFMFFFILVDHIETNKIILDNNYPTGSWWAVGVRRSWDSMGTLARYFFY